LKKLIIVLSLFVKSELSVAQLIDRQDLFWGRFMVQSNFNTKWFLINEIDNRRFFPDGIQHHTIQHNHLHYKIKPNMDIAWGQTFSWQSPQFPETENRLVVPEIRPFQEFNVSSPITKNIIFSSRIRIDERFIRKNDGENLLPGYNFNMRYRLRLQYQFFVGSKKRDNIKLINELMVNSGKDVNFFDQNRMYAGFEKVFNSRISVEAGYLRWFQQKQKFDTYFQRDILRFTLFAKLDILKKTK
jgi:hypothetical protein